MSSSTEQPILDSHIHLWPAAASNSSSHSWMTPSNPLAHEHNIQQYLEAVSGNCVNDEPKNILLPNRLLGSVYVETDRRVPGQEYNGSALQAGDEDAITRYAAHPLAELTFLRELLEDSSSPASRILKALVPWAPLDQTPEVLDSYLTIAKAAAGPEVWSRVKGFRFLLQGITDISKFQALVSSDNFINSLKLLGTNGFRFDVGVDARSGGIWQLEAFADIVDRVRKEGGRTVFIINHLCKPDFEGQLRTDRNQKDFERWKQSIQRFSQHEGVFMKLSGGFSELPDDQEGEPGSAQKVVTLIKPWIDVILESFTPDRIMFGSDWPVCNVRGPKNNMAWIGWKDIVEEILRVYAIMPEQRARIWSGTAVEAYDL